MVSLDEHPERGPFALLLSPFLVLEWLVSKGALVNPQMHLLLIGKLGVVLLLLRAVYKLRLVLAVLVMAGVSNMGLQLAHMATRALALVVVLARVLEERGLKVLLVLLSNLAELLLLLLIELDS